ncbi:MAG: AAA family ATPase [Succinivibrio sp.]|nr:AAA family ATPase [Succinivibrio sp.]
MIITVASTKGGVGKTTVAVQLSTYLKAVKKEDVWLVDGDEQRTALKAITMRQQNGGDSLPCSSYFTGREMADQLKAQQEKWKYIIVDVGGRDSGTLRAALLRSDLVLIPIPPRSFEFWAIGDIVKIINEARATFDDFKARVCTFLNLAEAQGSDNSDAAEQLNNIAGLEFIDATIRKRKAITVASSFGQSVFEMKPRDKKACDEFENLFSRII